MKISDALLYIIYKNGNKINTPELLNYMKQLFEYDMLEVNEDNISVSLSDKGLSRLVGSGLINKI